MRVLALILALALTACGPKPDPATPALWRVTGPGGQNGWLFGTIHALDRPAKWRGEAIDRALADAKALYVEVNLRDDGTVGSTFAALSASPGHPPLSARVPLALRTRLRAILSRHGLSDGQFARTETWAAALMLAQAGAPATDREHGIDRAVLDAAKGLPVVELEGARGQLSIFDRLPEAEQRDLLAAVVADEDALADDGPALSRDWREGDMAAIERETTRGLLADPELREALFTARNRVWTNRIAIAIDSGGAPFVAVGAAHMAGPDGLIAMLAARGYKIARIQ